MIFEVGAAATYLVVAIYVFCLFSIGYKVYLHAVYERSMNLWFEVFYMYTLIVIVNLDHLQHLF
jgi:hypothetical protein